MLDDTEKPVYERFSLQWILKFLFLTLAGAIGLYVVEAFMLSPIFGVWVIYLMFDYAPWQFLLINILLPMPFVYARLL